MQRRDLMKFMTGAGALNVGAMWGARELWANPTPQEMNARRGLPALKITNVKAILFAATRIRLIRPGAFAKANRGDPKAGFQCRSGTRSVSTGARKARNPPIGEIRG